MQGRLLGGGARKATITSRSNQSVVEKAVLMARKKCPNAEPIAGNVSVQVRPVHVVMPSEVTLQSIGSIDKKVMVGVKTAHGQEVYINAELTIQTYRRYQ